MIGESAPVTVAPPGLAVTVYDVIAGFPAVTVAPENDTTTCPSCPAPEISVGAVGTNSIGVSVTPLLGILVPSELVADTVNVCNTSLVNPVTVSGEAAPVTNLPPGNAVTVYDVIAGFPAVTVAPENDTTTCPSCPAPEISVGAVGTNSIGVSVTPLLGILVPSELVADTVNVCNTSLVNPVTVSGEAAPVTNLPPGNAVTVYDVIAGFPAVTVAPENVTVA